MTFQVPCPCILLGVPNSTGGELCHCPGKHKTLYNICTKLNQRLRHWTNIIQIFCVCWSFIPQSMLVTRYPANTPMLLVSCWASITHVGLALNQRWVNVSCSQGAQEAVPE